MMRYTTINISHPTWGRMVALKKGPDVTFESCLVMLLDEHDAAMAALDAQIEKEAIGQ